MKVGVIGLGGMGRSHLRVVRNFPFVTQAIGCDLNAAIREQVTADGYTVAADVPALIREKPEAVVVVTAPQHHAACIRPCLEAGIPVLSEKPLATRIEDSRALVELARARRLNLQVGFELRYCGITRAPTHSAEDAILSMEWVEKAEQSVRDGGAWIG